MSPAIAGDEACTRCRLTGLSWTAAENITTSCQRRGSGGAGAGSKGVAAWDGLMPWLELGSSGAVANTAPAWERALSAAIKPPLLVGVLPLLPVLCARSSAYRKGFVVSCVRMTIGVRRSTLGSP